jgi:ABC-type transport system involved in multi-copper enzyme maturation permease subunit
MTSRAAVGPLVRYSLRRRRGFLLSVALALAAFQFIIIFVARTLELSGRFQLMQGLMPDFIAEWTHMGAASYRGFVLFGYSDPVVHVFLAAIAISVGLEPVTEIESKFVDLLMARPVARRAVITRSIAIIVIVTAIALLTMFAANEGGLMLLTPSSAVRPPLSVVASLATGLGFLMLAWGSIALAIASASRRRATAGAICGFLAFAMFVLDYLGRFWDPAKTLSAISPFHYFDPFGMIGGAPLRLADVLALAAFSAVSIVVAHVAYARRDL